MLEYTPVSIIPEVILSSLAKLINYPKECTCSPQHLSSRNNQALGVSKVAVKGFASISGGTQR